MAVMLCTCGHPKPEHTLDTNCSRWQCPCQWYISAGESQPTQVVQIATAQPTPGDARAPFAAKPYLFGLDTDGDAVFWDWDAKRWRVLTALE